MTMAVDFVAGKAFEVLYAGVEDVIHKNRMFSELCKKIKPKLDRLAPVIQEMGKYNQMMDRTKELEDLEKLVNQGVVLFGKCSKLRNWNIYKKYKYAKGLLEFKESLQDELEVLEVLMARDVKNIQVVVKKTEAGVENIQVDVQTIREEVSMLVKHNGSVEIEELSAVLPELPKFIVGMEVPIEELKVKLLKDKVSMLIVTAPGGCGKTTLATMVCQDQDIKDKFQKNIFFVTFSKKPNLELIMKGLNEQRRYTVPTFQNEVTPVKWLKKVEMEKGNDHLLLVLDDVWSGSESLLEKFVYKMSNYKILVTSRSEFPRYGSSYHLPLLDHDNAMKLFRHTASLGDKSSHIPKYLSKEMVKRCNGFPLAITVVGRSLCGQPEEMWQSRIDEWSEGSSILDFETDLLLQLQSSVDVLDNAMPKVKECFLDLGVFPEDAQIEITALIDMWAELYDLQKETSCMAKLYELNNRSLVVLRKEESFYDDVGLLVMEGYGYSSYTVRQHDLLRELAIYNSKRIPMEYRERLIIEISGNNFPKWWREQKYPHFNARLVSISTDGELSVKFPSMELPEAEVLVLNLQSTTSYALPEFVERMDKLKVLLIMKYGEGLANLDNFQLLGSLSNLKCLRLDSIDLSCITENPVQLKNLHKLHLRPCMNLGDPVKILHTFPNLKEMVIERSYCWGFPEELCVLTSLTKLKLSDCEYCSDLPEAIGNLVNLEELRLDQLPRISEISDSIGNLKKLIFFEISGNRKISMLPEHIGKLTCLRQLILKYCQSLRALPESIGNLVNLEVLTVRGCSKLSDLPESIRNLQKLKFLDIGFGLGVRDLPEHIGELKSLKKLDMVYCFVEKLPQSVVDLEQLEEVICTHYQAKTLWAPMSATLKNLTIVLKNDLYVNF